MEDKDNPRKLVNIEINTRSYDVPHGKITFEEVVAIAYPPQNGQPRVACKVTYHNKNEDNDKKLVPGESVEVREGMKFTATATNES